MLVDDHFEREDRSRKRENVRADDENEVLSIMSRSDEGICRIEPYDNGYSRAGAKADAGGHDMGEGKAM